MLLISATETATYINGSAESRYNNALGAAIEVSQTAPGVVNIVNNTLTVTNTSALAISSLAVAATVKYAHNAYINSTVQSIDTFITQGIVNTEDNQGNILL